jgi:uncharacterized protein
MTTAGETAAFLLSGLAAGVMNALAGGGTILTFPVLVVVLGDAIRANATSTVALWPGAIASFWGYRREVATHRSWLRTLLVPSVLGGAVGSVILLLTPEPVFKELAPWLVLFATILFLVQVLTNGRVSVAPPPPAPEMSRRLAWVWLYQFLVGVYGGYFGAGIGILMLVALGVLGLTDIHAMNGLKNFFGACINGTACIAFVCAGLVDWRAGLLTMAGAVAGGLIGSKFARGIGKPGARWAVVVVGLFVTAAMLWERT